MPRRNALQAHMSKAALAKWAKIRAGESPAPTGAGRKPVPTVCPRCGELQPSVRDASKHCRGTVRKGRPPKVRPDANAA